MQIEQLRYFCMIVEQKTFSEAAFLLHISQSSLSKQVMKLEQELDTVLFNRSRRQVSLTKEGQQVYEDALRLLAEYDTLCANLKHLKKQACEKLRIAMLPVFSQYSLGHSIQGFLKHHNVQGNIQEIEERDLPAALQEQFDLYILRGEYEAFKEYSAYRSSEDELVCVVAKQHPLARKRQLAFSQLQNEKLLLFPSYTVVAKLCVRACEDAGFQPKIERHGRLETLLGAAREQEGVVLAMKGSLTQYQLSKLCIIPLQDTLKSCLYVYVNPSSIKKAGLRELLDYLQNEGEIKPVEGS